MSKGQSYARFVGADGSFDYPSWVASAWRRPGVYFAPGLGYLPHDIAAQLERDFSARYPQDVDWSKRYKAEAWIRKEVEEFEREKIHIAFDEHEIRARADRWSHSCALMQNYSSMADLCARVGIDAPALTERRTERGAMERMKCPRWWRRSIRKHYTRRAEAHLRGSGFVHKRRQVYASDRCVLNHGERKRRDREMLQSMVAVSDAGEQLELWDVVQASQANPTLRRNELMTRLAGFEQIAQKEGHVAEFLTLTCPSAFHCSLANGQKNPNWEGHKPRDGQQWLSKMWARARAKLRRISVLVYGIRVAEPHHDGTPHWHMVLFTPASCADQLRVVMRETWLSEYGHEKGARVHRVKFVRIDPTKGSACGYLAKYVAKNIDGYGVGHDYETSDQDAAESCNRVAAWASAHRIRQFQQIGGPAVTVWRELRRLRSGDSIPPTIAQAWQAADAGEWSAFVGACGGIAAGRGAIRIKREHTGEINQYDELRSADVVGVECGADSVRTRTKCWRIERKARDQRQGMGTANVGPLLQSMTTIRGTVRCGGSEENPRTPSPFFDLSYLGPVSITVRPRPSVWSARAGSTPAGAAERGQIDDSGISKPREGPS